MYIGTALSLKDEEEGVIRVLCEISRFHRDVVEAFAFLGCDAA
jgi:hypothetical protein